MTAGEKTSQAKMASTRSGNVDPGAEPFVEVVTGRGNLARRKGPGVVGENAGLEAAGAQDNGAA